MHEHVGREVSDFFTVDLLEMFEVVEDARIKRCRHHVRIGDLKAVLLSALKLLHQSLLEGFEIQWRKVFTRARLQRLKLSTPKNFAPKRLRESTVRKAELALQKLNDRSGQVQTVSSFDNIITRKLVCNHELSEVSNDFRRRSNLYAASEMGKKLTIPSTDGMLLFAIRGMALSEVPAVLQTLTILPRILFASA
mmetsp:Transcript_42754/g.167071  ORF Transcript_42754/g.167071 Transcript_42754/m.167071 type:complete len:194 (-) Transcript_42754:2792-3373(-)